MFGTEDDHSDSTNDSYECTLEAPLLWADDADEEACGSLASRERITGQRHRRHKRLHFRDSGSVHSYGNNDEESVYTYVSNQSSRKIGRERNQNSAKRCQKACGRFLLKGDIFCSFRTRYRPIFQIFLFSSLVYLVWDARQKLSDHRAQLRHLEEERDHILHQMSWIDNEAKKAHEHYSAPKLDGGGAFVTTNQVPGPGPVREELDRVQLRIQQNARDQISEMFGEKAMLLSLPVHLEDGDTKIDSKLSIVLSGDAPHAVSTFAQQVRAKHSVWENLSIQRLISADECSVVAIQAKTMDSNVVPVLEFVEMTRGCHEAGAVSLHPLESPGEESQRLMLKVRLTSSTARQNSGDVCIGRIVEGLEDLDALLPSFPVFNVEEATNH